MMSVMLIILCVVFIPVILYITWDCQKAIKELYDDNRDEGGGHAL